MASERTRDRLRWSELFVDRQFYERGPGGGRIVSVSRATQLFLASSFVLSIVVSLALLAAGIYGYRLYEERGARLAALEAELESGVAVAPVDGAVGADGDPLRAQLAAVRAELADATADNAAMAERAESERRALRSALERAEAARADAQGELASSRARLAALEEELGMTGPVAGLLDEAGQPRGSLESVTPGDLAALGMELRLVERERDGARAQLDSALARIAELEDTRPTPPLAVDDPAVADRFAALGAERDALAAARAALEDRLAGLEADFAEIQASAARARNDFLARLADADDRIIALQEERQAVARDLAESRAAREQLEVERDELVVAERDLEAARSEAAERARAMAEERDRLAEENSALGTARDALARERDALAAEREALAADAITMQATIAALQTEFADREAELLAERDVLAEEAAAAAAALAALVAESEAAADGADAAEAMTAELQAQFAAGRAELLAEREALRAERDSFADAARAADDRVVELELEIGRLAAAREADRIALTTALAEREALETALAADAVPSSPAADPDTAVTAAALLALESRNAELEAQLAAAEAAADAATQIATDATRLAELAARGDDALADERDTAQAGLQIARTEIADLREDMAALTKASNDALAAQNAAHATERAGLLDTIEGLEAEIAALVTQNQSLTALTERLETAAFATDGGPAADNGGDREQAARAALRAANERIMALEAELAATARLVAEIGPGAEPATSPARPVEPAAGESMANETELSAALERIKNLDAELTTAQDRVATLENLLQAEWPGPPRPAPR